MGHCRLRYHIFLPLLIVVVAVLPAIWPFYSLGLTRSFDGGLHLLRIATLERQLELGNWYPRWSPDLLLGYGYPLFSFYAPATYYLVLLLHALGADLYSGFIVACVLAVLLGGTGMYVLALEIFAGRRLAALVTAIAYAYSPYLLTNIYIRGALAEAAAQAILPWLFWLAYRLVGPTKPGHWLPWFSLILALLAVTHNISLLLVPPVLFLFILIVWQSKGFGWQRILPTAVGLVLAMAISAFFWVPVLIERQFLAQTAVEIAKSIWLPGSMWTWGSFLDLNLQFGHTFERPIRLGVVQLGLAIAGILLARRTDPIWSFLIAISIGSGALMFAWALPFWLSFDILASAQFAWRLLSILSFTLALLAGGIAYLSNRWVMSLPIALAAVILIIFAGTPRLEWMDLFEHATVELHPAVFAQTELEKGVLLGGEGNSSIQEFRPRWAARSLLADHTQGPSSADTTSLTIRPRVADGLFLTADVTATTMSAMRLATFYYPTWHARIDGRPTAAYASGELGLLTVEIPPGKHSVTVDWRSTPVQRIASAISFVALILLAIISVKSRTLAASVVSTGLVAIGIASVIAQGNLGPTAAHQPAVIAEPLNPLEITGMHLVGVHTSTYNDAELIVHPYWHIQQPIDEQFVLNIQLASPDSTIIAATDSEPYYNTLPTSALPDGALFDDVYRLRLPTAAAPGRYTLFIGFSSQGEVVQSPVKVAEVQLSGTNPHIPGYTPVHARFGDVIELQGYAATGLEATQNGPRLQGILTGDHYRQILFWSADGFVPSNYHAFVHLADQAGNPIAQEDQLPGPFFQPPRLWTQQDLARDSYLLRIPKSAVSGLYYPMVGMYEFETVDRLPAYLAGSDRSADHISLPPIKVINRSSDVPDTTTAVRFADVSTLEGYSLHMPEPLAAGSLFTVTLFHKSLGGTNIDLTRFVQLYDPERGIAAQADSPPVGGHNPTWGWIPDETIVDPVALRVVEAPTRGNYTLYVGFYDPAEPSQRVPVYSDGQILVEGWAPLTQVAIR